MNNNDVDQYQDVSLLEVLDRVLNKGVVLSGDVVISVADIDLIYLGIKIILTSVETMHEKSLTIIKSDQTKKI